MAHTPPVFRQSAAADQTASLPQRASPRSSWGRPLALAALVVFVISCMFPLVAGLGQDVTLLPDWWGAADVGLAFLVAVLTFVMIGLARGHIDPNVEAISYRAYRTLIHAVFAPIVLFLLLGNRVVWGQCLPGFAWRAWLFLYLLPYWLTVWHAAPPRP